MIVLGIYCQAKKGFSYAIIEGNGEPKLRAVGIHKLSKDVGLDDPGRLNKIREKTIDLVNTYKPERACYYTSEGAGPKIPPAKPFKYRMEGAVIVTLQQNGIRNIEGKLTQTISSDLGVKGSSRGGDQRERIRGAVDGKFNLRNSMERDAVAAAWSVLEKLGHG